MTGRLFAVVGPSGVGKDTLIEAARQARPDLVILRRVITRPTAAGGEDYEGVTEADFAARLARGDFALCWRAHGLSYGIPRDQLDPARDVLFNGSRAALEVARDLFPDLIVIRITAPSEVLMQRLLARGRETRDEITARIARANRDVPEGLRVLEVVNDGPLPEAVTRFLAALQPVSA